MNKNDLIRKLMDSGAGKLGAKSATLVVNQVLSSIMYALVRGDMVTLQGFGTFKVVDIKAHPYRNLATGEKAVSPAFRSVKFKMCDALRDRVNDGKPYKNQD